jgi:hypothetical protein
MSETLLSPSNVLLYGRVLEDLAVTRRPAPSGTPPNDQPPSDGEPAAGQPHDDVDPPNPAGPNQTLRPPTAPPRLGGNNFLQAQLASPGARLARIYAFSYEGHFYDLARPVIFLVHGPGRDPEAFRPAVVGAGAIPAAARANARFTRAPADADRTGVANTSGSFSEDIRVWSYDKGDFSIRLDVETGPFDQILLDATLGAAGGTYAGANARIAGANVGANARIAGANVGANVGANAGTRRGGGWSD